MNHDHNAAAGHNDHPMNPHPYRRLLVMAALSLISMYVLMFAMVNTIGHVYSNLNQIYLAGMMTAPMVVIGLAVMSSMYPNKRLNVLVLAASVIAGLTFFAMIRQQTAISDKQFLRSMIPHHASAILMCQRASIQDPEIRALCRTIISSQQAEIDQMRAKLAELEK